MRYKIIKSNRRKTISLKVEDNGILVIRAPWFATNEQIALIVATHKKWIEKSIERINKIREETPDKKFVQGEKFPYLGRYFPLKIVKGQKGPLKFENGFFLSEFARRDARRFFIKWYKKSAYVFIKERVEFFARNWKINYAGIKITSAKRRWGSCSAKKNLNFSYRLIMAPPSVIDYVVVHELAHTKIMNHSPEFWEIVRKMLPSYESERQWLKENGHKLVI